MARSFGLGHGSGCSGAPCASFFNELGLGVGLVCGFDPGPGLGFGIGLICEFSADLFLEFSVGLFHRLGDVHVCDFSIGFFCVFDASSVFDFGVVPARDFGVDLFLGLDVVPTLELGVDQHVHSVMQGHWSIAKVVARVRILCSCFLLVGGVHVVMFCGWVNGFM